MKKIFILVLFVAIILPFSACSIDTKTDVLNNVSDLRYSIFAGQNADASITLSCGMRENPYSYDGVSHKKVEFGIVTVTIKNSELFKDKNFELFVGNNKIRGNLEENPYDHTFMTDIEKIVSCDDAVYISIPGFVENMQLICESKNWQIQYQDAFDIGFQTFENDLKNMYDKKKFKGECYLKIIMDQKDVSNPFYWCFMVCGQDGTTKSVIFDVNSGEVVTEKA